VRDVRQSKSLNGKDEPCTIISASGMCEAGRIRHHIKNNIRDPRNTILIPGYQAAYTLGRRLVDGAKEITLFHEKYNVRADVEQIHGFSGHADQSDLLRLLTPLAKKGPRAFLVHGEEDQSSVLRDKLAELGMKDVSIAKPGMRAEL